MKSINAKQIIASITDTQWGMITAAQARDLGLGYMDIKRLADSGSLFRLTHGVYRFIDFIDTSAQTFETTSGKHSSGTGTATLHGTASALLDASTAEMVRHKAAAALLDDYPSEKLRDCFMGTPVLVSGDSAIGTSQNSLDEIRAAWLAAEPHRLGPERIKYHSTSVVISGVSASNLLGIGNFCAPKIEITTASRRQTERNNIRYRTRTLPILDVAIVDGLPVTTFERTIADLLEKRYAINDVADAFWDATALSELNNTRLVELLAPLAERQGFRQGSGLALLERLQHIASMNFATLANEINDVFCVDTAMATTVLGQRLTPASLRQLAAFRSLVLQPAWQHQPYEDRERRLKILSNTIYRIIIATAAGGNAGGKIKTKLQPA